MPTINFGCAITTLLSLILLLTSLPTATASSSSFVNRRAGIVTDYIGVYICDAPDFTGACNWIKLDSDKTERGDCLALHHDTGIKSIGPDWGIQLKILGEGDNCSGDIKTPSLACPGIWD